MLTFLLNKSAIAMPSKIFSFYSKSQIGQKNKFKEKIFDFFLFVLLLKNLNWAKDKLN